MKDTGYKSHVEIKGVAKGFQRKGHTPVTVLNEVNLNIEQGEFFCIIGHSGCGKSTLLNLLGGFLKPDTGTIKVKGREIVKPAADRGMVFQEYGLFPWLNVLDNVAFGPIANGKSSAEARKISRDYIEMVGLSHVEKLLPDQLSGGMKQRVAIARAMANQPEVLLMDEPFGALDAFTRVNLREMLQKVWIETKVTVVFVTHSVEEAIYLGQRIGVMKRETKDMHRIINVDLEYPRNNYHASFLSLRNELEEELKGEVSQ